LYKTQLVVCIFSIALHAACTPIHTPAVHAKTNHASNSALSNIENYLFQVNKIRSQARKCGNKYFSAAPALKLDDKLNVVAKSHSIDMSKHNSLSHSSSNGDDLVQRLSKVNYTWRAIAENIAHNQRSVTEVLGDWLTSPGHCSNLMSADYQYIGLAQVNWYWTQVFATPR